MTLIGCLGHKTSSQKKKKKKKIQMCCVKYVEIFLIKGNEYTIRGDIFVPIIFYLSVKGSTLKGKHLL